MAFVNLGAETDLTISTGGYIPPTGGSHILTEAGDILATEGGDEIIIE